MAIAFYAGSFDPFTKGHLHIVKVASQIFDKVIVGVGINADKKTRFDKEMMLKAIKKSFIDEKITNCEVISFDGLTCYVAKEKGADFLIRGIRNGVDYDYEENLALINEDLAGIETIYIRAGKWGAVSSSMVVELIKRNKDISKYVPQAVIDCVINSNAK